VETVHSSGVLFPLIVTLLTPFGIYIARRKVDVREGVSFLGGLFTFLSVLALAPLVLAGKVHSYTLLVLMEGVEIRFAADGLSMVFGLVASFLWIIATSYNIGYMRSLKEHAQTRYYICFAIAIFGAMGVAFSGNIFTMYLFYEVITICTCPLVAHHEDDEAYRGMRKYLVYLLGASKLFFFPAMVLTYLLVGNLDFNLRDVANGIFPAGVNPTVVAIVYVLFVAGMAKAAIMPLHNWLPSAMVAPTPVSGLLHAVAVVKAGVFCICRVILSVFGLQAMHGLFLGIPTAYVAAFTIVMASMIAMTKDDLKARLAYSTVSQLSYVVIGVAMLNSMSIAGSTMHIAHHAFSKITLFFGAGAIYVATREKKISKLGGIGRKMPWTLGAFSLAALSMIGIPPVSGFISKWYLLLGSMETGHQVLLFALLASTVLNGFYFGQIIYISFFGAPAEGDVLDDYREAPLFMVIPIVITSIISVMLGLFPNVFYQFIAMMNS
jgi:multicomponent Na+:H+ antiporter subunit D